MGRVINGFLPFLFLPVYFHYLGPEAYGLYALLLSAQAILGFLDFGLSSSVTREFSRKVSYYERAVLLATFERSHLAVGIAVALMMLITVLYFPLADTATPIKLFQSQSVLLPVVGGLFLLAGWSLPFYSGALIGAELQIELNMINLLSGGLRYCGGWLLLARTDFGLPGLVVLQAFVSLGSVCLMRQLLMRRIPVVADAFRFEMAVLNKHAPYTIKIFGVLLMGAFLSQADKIFISSLLGLKDFGYYAIAGALVSAVAVVVHPITSTYFPRFVQLHDSVDVSSMRQVFQSCVLLVCVLVLAPSTVAIVQPQAVLELWTKQGADIHAAASFLPLLMLATHAAMFMTLLQSVHTAGNRPQYIMLANLMQLTVLGCGIGLASAFENAFVVLGALVVSPLVGVVILSRYLSTSGSGLSWLVLMRPLRLVGAVYLFALLSRTLVERLGLIAPVGVVALTVFLTMIPAFVALSVYWCREARMEVSHVD